MALPEVKKSASLRTLNTFGVDVQCNLLAEVDDTDALVDLLAAPSYKDVPKLVIGGGSNLLFTRDFPGLVILNRISGISIEEEVDDSVLVRAGAGVVWHDLVVFTVDHGWGGLENLSLIPGTVGASPIQNIGAYGVEMKDCFERLNAVSLNDGSKRSFTADECRFGYRDSIFKREAKGVYIITEVFFRLRKNPVVKTEYGAIREQLQKEGIEHPTIADVSRAVIAIRSSKLPDPALLGNAGSFFKNPEVPKDKYESIRQMHPDIVGYPTSQGSVKLAAGWLIEQCGWKGLRSGNVGMHGKQALVLVNYGDATGEELISHARKVQESVKTEFGVDLEMEVNIL